MRWLIDEMLPPGVAKSLGELGHDALAISPTLVGASDPEVFALAVAQKRLVVTENFADFAVMLAERLGRDEPCVPVVFVHKSHFPKSRGALATHLARRLDQWATDNPKPYVGAHWLTW